MDPEQYAREVAIIMETQLVNDQKFSQPAMKLIDAKALVLGGKVHPQEDGSFLVDGAQGEAYPWNAVEGCACPQATKAHKYCKHAVAIELFKRTQQAIGNHPLALPLPPPSGDARLAQAPPAPEGVALDDTPWPEDDAPPLTITTTPEDEAALDALAAPHGPLVRLPAPPGASLGAEPYPSAQPLAMLRSCQVQHVIAALVQAQAEMKNPRFDTTNPHFRTRYASLAAVRDAVTPALARQGLVVTQLLSAQDGGIVCETILWHTSGQYLGATLRLPVGKADAQGYGAASTYARRYGLMALCNVVGDEDDDGASLARGPQAPAAGTDAGPPPPAAPVDPTQAKRRIMQLLVQLGHSREELTLEGVTEWVGTYANLPLEAKHYATILERLEDTLTAKEV